jgi:hypothetical protein
LCNTYKVFFLSLLICVWHLKAPYSSNQTPLPILLW